MLTRKIVWRPRKCGNFYCKAFRRSESSWKSEANGKRKLSDMWSEMGRYEYFSLLFQKRAKSQNVVDENFWSTLALTLFGKFENFRSMFYFQIWETLIHWKHRHSTAARYCFSPHAKSLKTNENQIAQSQQQLVNIAWRRRLNGFCFLNWNRHSRYRAERKAVLRIISCTCLKASKAKEIYQIEIYKLHSFNNLRPLSSFQHSIFSKTTNHRRAEINLSVLTFNFRSAYFVFCAWNCIEKHVRTYESNIDKKRNQWSETNSHKYLMKQKESYLSVLTSATFSAELWRNNLKFSHSTLKLLLEHYQLRR